MFDRKTSRTFLLLVLALLGWVATTSVDAQYVEQSKAIACECRTISLLLLVGADYDQGVAAQNAAWTSFKNTYVGIVDADRLGNRTKTYNCHSYAFNGSDRWLNSPSNFFGTTSGCWKVDGSGTVKSSSSHSCLVSNNTGKCGSLFLCKNNQHVYNPMPTTIYKYVP